MAWATGCPSRPAASLGDRWRLVYHSGPMLQTWQALHRWRRVRGLVIMLLLSCVVGCASKPTLHINVERNAATDFSAYRTYVWADQPPEPIPGQPRTGRDLMDWRIRTVIENQLAVRGYDEVSSGRSDLVISYHLDFREAHTDSLQDFINYRESGGDQSMQEAYVYG
ncbi:MAG: DUF4136 domain-containing protein, partial [Gaiellaceae bacterium]